MEGELSLPYVYHILHAYVAWWVLLAVFLCIIALLVKYYPVNEGEDHDEYDH